MAKTTERAIEALRKECKEAHRKLEENKDNLAESAERMNELLRAEVKRIRAEQKNVELLYDLRKLNIMRPNARNCGPSCGRGLTVPHTTKHA